jgi:uncharacterized protein
MKTVKIATGDSRKIEGTLFLPKNGRALHPAALFLHGWGSDRKKHFIPAEALAGRGFVSLAIDLRGHGKTDRLGKSISARENLQDALAAYDFLASRKDVDKKWIGVAGFSYGGFLAILLTARRKVRWLALRSPALYRDEDLDIPKAQIKRRGLMTFRRQSMSSTDCAGLRAAAAIRAPVLLIEAEHDRVVPRQQIRNYLNAFAKSTSVKHRVILGAHHAMSPEELQLATDAMLGWVASFIKIDTAPL